MNGVDDQTKP
jgi:hypothetical protein